MAPDSPEATLLGAVALTDTGERLGLVVDLYPREADARPRWAWVRTGIVESDVSVVSLADSRSGHGSLIVPVSADRAVRAPQHPAGSTLTPAQERALRDHYAVNPAETEAAAVDTGGAAAAPDSLSSRTSGTETLRVPTTSARAAFRQPDGVTREDAPAGRTSHVKTLLSTVRSFVRRHLG